MQCHGGCGTELTTGLRFCNDCRQRKIAEQNQAKKDAPPQKWSCVDCGSSKKPSGRMNPTLCRSCLGKARKRSSKVYNITCGCGVEFQAKSKNALYCPGCRDKMQQAYEEKQAERKKARFGYCGQCKTAPITYQGSSLCVSCYKESKAVYELLKGNVKEPYRLMYIGGKLEIVRVISTSASAVELVSLLKEQGMADDVLSSKVLQKLNRNID